jgi:hypothetical protein
MMEDGLHTDEYGTKAWYLNGKETVERLQRIVALI